MGENESGKREHTHVILHQEKPTEIANTHTERKRDVQYVGWMYSVATTKIKCRIFSWNGSCYGWCANSQTRLTYDLDFLCLFCFFEEKGRFFWYILFNMYFHSVATHFFQTEKKEHIQFKCALNFRTKYYGIQQMFLYVPKKKWMCIEL